MEHRYMQETPKDLKQFYILWSTQSLSQLGSAMTTFALTLWLYQSTGSALRTAFLMVYSYVPYVAVSIFAGALSDRWDKKKTMLACDTFAACCTVCTLFLLVSGKLCPWHLYVLNILTGLMNTIQDPAGNVAYTLITPQDSFHRTSGLMSLSRSLISVFQPVLATAIYSLGGVQLVAAVDLFTFLIAFLALAFFIKLPDVPSGQTTYAEASLTDSVRSGLAYLRDHRLVFLLIQFLAGVNLVASAFDAVLPSYILPNPAGGEAALGLVTAAAGASMLLGSLAVSALPAPRDRVRVILYTMVFSLTADNFLMPFTDRPWLWCVAQFLGYFPVSFMSASMDVVVRSSIPAEMQGRVYACRNTLQFFTIPVGYLLGGFLTDHVFEPLIRTSGPDSLPVRLFGAEKGAGAGMVIFLLGVTAILICAVYGSLLRPYSFKEAVSDSTGKDKD